MSAAEFDAEAYKGIHGMAEQMMASGARLVAVIAQDNGDGTLQLIYLFDSGGKLTDRRYTILPDWEVDSVSDVYSGAVNMERESVDLLGVKFKGITPGLLLVPGKSEVTPLRKGALEPKEVVQG